jgi:polysaccharide biosynthesis transport protein
MREAWQVAQRTEEQIQQAFEGQQQQALDLNVQASMYVQMQAEVKRLERLGEILDSRIRELNVTEDTGALNVTVLDVARPEIDPTSPQKARVMAMGLVLGLMLGVGSALLRDWMDQRLRSVEEIRALLGLPVLGVVPHMLEKQSDPERARLVETEPMSDVAEAYRTIRTAVYFGMPDKSSKTILITSPASGDGKSTLASNLAIAMAQAGQRVLLLDADFRRPRQHEIFGVESEKGLSSVLAGKAALANAIQRTSINGLSVLPCGPVPPNPSEILNSRKFMMVLEKLAEHYDHVLLDSPPVAPVTDARILGALCDTTLLVLRAEKSTRKISEHAIEGLLSTGATILGAIVNDVTRGRGSYGYYSRYGDYQYGYGRTANGKVRDSEDTVAPAVAVIKGE